MNHKLSAVIVAATTLGAAIPATAAPTLYPRAGNRLSEVVNNTPTVVISDTQNNKKFWVLPAKTGSMELTNLFYGANTGFCSEMSLLQSTSFELAQEISIQSTRILQYQGQIDQKTEELAVLRQAEADLLVPELRTIQDLRRDIEDIEDRIDDLRDLLLDCETDSCEEDIEDEIETLKDEKARLKDELRVLERQHRDAVREWERAKARVEAKDEEIQDIKRAIRGVTAELIESKNQIFSMYRHYGTLEGGFGGVNFSTNWTSSVETLRNAHRAKGFVFDPIDTSDVRVFPQLVPGIGTDDYLAGLPSVMSYTLNGRQISPTDSTQHLASFPDTMVANMRLSLVGACPYKFPAQWDLAEGQNGLPLYGLTSEYAYPSAFRTHVRASYNLWSVYEHMKRVSVDGGFFSTSTSVEETVDTDGDSTWTFHFYDESGMTDAEKTAVERQIKLELMADVLRLMGVPSQATVADNLNPMAPPPSGAAVLGQGIDSVCGWYNPYCSGASWILRGLQAIFGGSETETRFRETHNYTATREYSADFVQPRTGIVTFTR
jgi:hypothetical protein